MIDTATLNIVLSIGTILLQGCTFLLLCMALLRNRVQLCADVSLSIQRYAYPAAFIMTLGGTIMTLYYSDVLGFVPCGLCWMQRVFLYPQVIVFTFASIRKIAAYADVSIALSVFGACFALYQHYLQMGGADVLPCPASGVSDCAQRILFEFGYITFPLMAFSLFAFLIILMLFVRRR